MAILSPLFDPSGAFHYNQPMSDRALRPSLKTALVERHIPDAGWSYEPDSGQSALEPTCLALLALRRESGLAQMQGLQFLLRLQNPNGSWPAFTGDDGEGSGLSALGVMALINNGEIPLQAERGLKWLLDSKGKESNWLWRWKFRTTDTHVRFNPDKFGWPWMPGTCSWVIPTALSIIALRQAFVYCKRDQVSCRIRRGVDMLLDRACPGGGWNAGNGVVYGSPLAPHLDATAAALLALRGEERDTTVAESLDWLEHSAPTCPVPWSLAWSILSLDAHDRPSESLIDRLWAMSDFYQPWDSATLALVTLALDCPVAGHVFKVIA